LHSRPDLPVPTNLIHAGGSVLTPVLDTLIYVDQAGQSSPSRCTNTTVTGVVFKNTMSSIGTWLSKLKSTIIPEQTLHLNMCVKVILIFCKQDCLVPLLNKTCWLMKESKCILIAIYVGDYQHK